MAQRRLNRYRLDQLEAIRKDSNITRLSAGLRRINASSKKLAAVIRSKVKDSMMPEAVAAAAELENTLDNSMMSAAAERMDEQDRAWLKNHANAAAHAAIKAQDKREWCLKQAERADLPHVRDWLIEQARQADNEITINCAKEKIYRGARTPREAIAQIKTMIRED